MIRKTSSKDKISVAIYLANKLNISLVEANRKANKIIKSGLPSFLKEDKDLQGICWVETRLLGDKKEKFIEILVNNWRLAESYIQMLRWELNGTYYFSIPRKDVLNRTYNKNSIKFIKIIGNDHLYNHVFERRIFHSFKSEDIDAN